jgi:hypothetical protein
MQIFQEFQNNNGYVYILSDGNEVYSKDRMTLHALREFEEQINIANNFYEEYVDEEALFGSYFIMGEPRESWSF